MRRWILRGALGLGLLVLTLVVSAWLLLRSSLPELAGERRASGLAAAVQVERDARGSVTLTATSRPDLAYALGYVHAQDRWFQMDLLRRAAAGELAALLGPALLDTDRSLRVHRFRTVARAALERAPAAERALLEAYARGANEGLASLGGRPWEYWLLRARPAPWRAEDSLLVAHAMFVDLQGNDWRRDRQRAALADALPPAAAAFVQAAAADLDAALDDSPAPAPLLPTAAEYDLRALGDLDFAPPDSAARERSPLGSNNWAVAGTRSATGSAIVANDMHLGLRVPNTWYHARLRQSSGDAPVVDVTGVTLPGTPAVVAGSTGRVAWAFTNSYADFSDLVVLEPAPADPGRYRTPDGSEPYARVVETIAVAGGAPVEFEVLGTRWGPVIGEDHRGRRLALAWTAHSPEAVNLALADLETAPDVEAALAVAARAGIPGQNFVVGDRAGRIAWAIAGRIPVRGGSGALPKSSTDPTAGFSGWLAAEARPVIADPAGGQIWTANSRIVGGEALAVLGDGGYDRGARAIQIRDALRAAGDRQTVRDSLTVHMDDRALFLGRWHALLARLLSMSPAAPAPESASTPGTGEAGRAEARAVLASFRGRAAVDDAAYRLVREFRNETLRRAYFALIAPARAQAPADFEFRPPASFEGPLWALVTARPAHLLPPGHADWDAFLLAALDATVARLREDCATLAACTWGARNTTRISHPLSAALPFLGRWLDMPRRPLPGDNDVPLVQGRSFGASERFAVAVGHEADAWFHMPGGQSGHFLSPYYRSWHAAWETGEPTPFLPGAGEHVLRLVP